MEKLIPKYNGKEIEKQNQDIFPQKDMKMNSTESPNESEDSLDDKKQKKEAEDDAVKKLFP
eukprot:12295946-Heterocapsa_arctica.AAC.1